MNRFRLTLLIACGILLAATGPAGASDLLNRDAVLGATAGAVAGGIIGHQSDHRNEGALVGSLAGYAIGTMINRQKQHERELTIEEIRRAQQIASLRQAEAAMAAPESIRPEKKSLSEEQQILLQASPLFTVREAK